MKQNLPPRIPLDLEKPFASHPQLWTGRMLLRPIISSDAQALLDIYADAEVGRYNAWKPLESLEDARKKVQRFTDQFRRKERIRWGLVLKGTDRVIGDVAFVRLEARGYRGEIGFNLAKAHWRKGLMLEAVTAVIEYGFREMGLNRIEGYVLPENVASTALLKKLGFQCEGLLRQAGYMDGRHVDVNLFALLFEEHFGAE
jgi:ribosomal-protein-alanine N-acetyltransferase